ncbi:MAG: patatin-like phospholipase family protein [Bacteroidota bacterium]
MKRALVLSGGGANGAFQFGALKYIEEEIKPRFPDFHYNIIAGVSVGAINGTMMAMDKFAYLQRIWNSPTLDKLIYRGKLELLNITWRLVSRERSILDNHPLFQLLRRYVKLEDIRYDKYDLRVGAVSLEDGKFYAFRPQQFEEDEEFQKAILASTSIPILWQPVDQIKTKDRVIKDLVDGSIRDTSPLGQVIQDRPDEVIIINCTSRRLPLPKEENSGSSIFSIARRSLVDIAIDEIFINDLREFLTINDLVGQAKAQAPHVKLYRRSVSTGKRLELKQFQTVLIEPQDQMGSIIDFSPKKIAKRIEQGYEAAREAFMGYEDRNTGRLYAGPGR